MPRGGKDPDRALREVRRRFKRIRAALRLLREDLGDAVYRQENCRFRDAARPLRELRDAQILVETLDNLTEGPAGPRGRSEVRDVRKILTANRKAVTRSVVREQNVFAAVAETVEPVLTLLGDWTIQREVWSVLESGLRRVYVHGIEALEACDSDPSVENLHEWRKQVKYLWHALQLLARGFWADGILAELDTDKDGVISRCEFEAVLKRRRRGSRFRCGA